jgi:hypothetical protein
VIALVLAAALALTPTGSLTLDAAAGGTASFTVAYSNLYWIPEVSVSCPGYLDVQTEASASDESQYEVSPWHVSFEGIPAGTCTASLFYYTWKNCRNPKEGPFYCTRQTGIGVLDTLTFEVAP